MKSTKEAGRREGAGGNGSGANAKGRTTNHPSEKSSGPASAWQQINTLTWVSLSSLLLLLVSFVSASSILAVVDGAAVLIGETLITD